MSRHCGRGVSADGEKLDIRRRFLFALARFRRRPFPLRVDGEAEDRPAALPVSYFQQQQVYRRDHDDRAQGGRERRADRICALGADRTGWADSQFANTL